MYVPLKNFQDMDKTFFKMKQNLASLNEEIQDMLKMVSHDIVGQVAHFA